MSLWIQTTGLLGLLEVLMGKSGHACLHIQSHLCRNHTIYLLILYRRVKISWLQNRWRNINPGSITDYLEWLHFLYLSLNQIAKFSPILEVLEVLFGWVVWNVQKIWNNLAYPFVFTRFFELWNPFGKQNPWTSVCCHMVAFLQGTK